MIQVFFIFWTFIWRIACKLWAFLWIICTADILGELATGCYRIISCFLFFRKSCGAIL